jgi:HAMP domain-containing protein
MTSIRNRLLSLLLPPLIAFIILISLFFYYKWNEEITKSFSANLKSIVVMLSHVVNPDDIAWVLKHRNDPEVAKSPIYQDLQKKLIEIKRDLPVVNLYIVSIEPVEPGEKVLPDNPDSPINNEQDPRFEYRQFYLFDAQPGKSDSFSYDFSETNENEVYYTRKPLITPIYQGLGTSERFMTGYAPLIDKEGNVLALVGADINLALVEKNLKNALIVIVLSGIAALGYVLLSSLFIASKITEPVQKLKDAALVLASGEYEESIKVTGPKEIVELANTLNTMRECLVENISRLTDYTVSKEKLYGEYECAELLQTHMLDDVMDDFKDPRLKVKGVSLPSSTFIGVNLNIKKEGDSVRFLAEEASLEGFQGIYDLLANGGRKKLEVSIDFENGKIFHVSQGMPDPLIWSVKSARFVPSSEYSLEAGDFIILYNTGLVRQYPHTPHIKEWLAKVLKHFTKEGFDLTLAMLQSELNFLAKKNINHEDIHILLITLSDIRSKDY